MPHDDLPRLSRAEIAARIARDIPDGAIVNLGIGAPTLVGNFLLRERDVLLHSENGILGMGPSPPDDAIDWDLINAGKQPVTLLAGGAFFHHGDSFAMIRGRHIDICVLGAYQVSITGDLANWHTGQRDAIPAVGGAMDLAIGARQVFVMMDLLTRTSESKLVPRCTYPLTALACVTRLYTDLGVFALGPAGARVLDLPDGITGEALSRLTGLKLAGAG